MENSKSTSTTSKQVEWPAFLDLDGSASLKQPVQCEIQGTVPSWIKGSLYRNGSGVYKMGETRHKHLFDGFAVISRWTIQNGRVTFLSTVLDSSSYQESVKLNRFYGMSFGCSFPDPCKTLFDRFFSYFKPQEDGQRDNTAVNIVEFGDKLFALTEGPFIHEVNGETMLSNGSFNITKNLAVHFGTAHPHMEKDGSMIYYGTNMKDYKKAFNFVHIKPSKDGASAFSEGKIVASIESRWKINLSYTHSFGLTENYIVYYEQPVVFSVIKLLASSFTKCSVEEAMSNYPQEPVFIHIVNKKTGEKIPIKYIAPHGFVFHFINCYEENNQVICDICLYENGDGVKEYYLDEVLRRQRDKEPCNARFARYVLPLSLDGAEAGKNLVKLGDSQATAILRKEGHNVVDVTPDPIFDKSVTFELPRINYDYNGEKYRFCYATSLFNTDISRLMKLDVKTKQMLEWKCPGTHSPGEPVFIKSPDGKNEDDGVVLSPIHAHSTDHSSFLVILDAKTFKEIARASVPSHVKINLTFHGDFYNRVY